MYDLKRTLGKVYNQRAALLLIPYGPLLWAYIEYLDSKARGKWQRLPAIVCSALADHYGMDLSEVIFADGVDTKHGKAIVFENRIYFPNKIDILNDSAHLRLMLHELEHVRQYKAKGGLIKFLKAYIGSSLQVLSNGSVKFYDDNALERQAREKADSLFGIAEQKILGATVLDESSQSPPALCTHVGKMYLAWRDDKNHIRLSSSTDGKSFMRLDGAYDELAGNTPVMASFEGELFIAWLSSDPSNKRIHMTYSRDGMSFATSSGLYEQTTIDVPALTEFNGQLYAAWRGGDPGNHHIHLARSEDGKTFAP